MSRKQSDEPSGRHVRPVRSDDVPALKTIIDGTGLFASAMLDGMIAGYLAGEASNEAWLTLDDGSPKALAYYAPERMTEGTWNLLLLAVHPDQQGSGYGSALIRHVEAALAQQGHRLLLVETSGLPEFERTRSFYEKLGYLREARIRDFYERGNDKIVFRKELGRG